MIINKFTLAAALSIGIMASTTYAGLTQDLSTVPSTSTLAACPLSGCPSVVTPQTATCPSCKCNPCTCNPCAKSCDPCCDPCTTGSACPCEPCCAAPEPACAVCPSPCCGEKFKQQAYAYPKAIYGNNQIIGERNNGLFMGDSSYTACGFGVPLTNDCACGCNTNITGAAANIDLGCGGSNLGLNIGNPSYAWGPGMTGAAAPCCSSPSCGYGCGCGIPGMTGAASPMPCLEPAPCLFGVPVDRGCECGCAAPCSSCSDACGCATQISTRNSTTINRKSLVPFTVPSAASPCASGAAPLISAFEDVPAGFWAGCDINKLTENNIIAGYPDKTFKPHLPVTRAEMSSLIAKGFNLNDKMSCPEKTFLDVPKSHWANKTINNAVANGMMVGYPGCKFKPNQPISRAEALTILSKGINCPMDECKANEIIGQFCDANTVPSWARIPIAKAIQSGAMSDFPCPNMISPNKDAERAEIASMLENIRVALGYSCVDKTATASPECACATPSPCGCAAYMVKEDCIKLPTLQVKLKDEVTAKAAHVGDRFAAVTTEDVTINGVCYPCGSKVMGKVLEVIRPDSKCQGALRLSFNTIQNGDCKADLPNQVLTAQVSCAKKQNAFARVIQFPFTLVGGLVGDIGRTIGGGIITASNAVDNTVQGFGVGTGELLTGQFGAAGRSYVDVAGQVIMAPIDVTRTALSGTVGALQYSGDEVAYLVNPCGMKVASVHPKEKVTIAFGCPAQK